MNFWRDIIHWLLVMGSKLISRSSHLWRYLLPEQRGLVGDSEELAEEAAAHARPLTDYSYLVFPVAKMYEGFLKRLFLDLKVIDEFQYKSEHFRIGKALNPNLEAHLKLEGIYEKVCSRLESYETAHALWSAWKKGRNLLFHYFPENLHRIGLAEAHSIIQIIIEAGDRAVRHAGGKVGHEKS